MSDTFTLPMMRSSIIRTIEGCCNHTNTTNLRRLKNQPQNKEIQQQKTDRIFSVSERALFVLPYADTVIFFGHTARLGGHLGGHTARLDGYVLHGQVFKKSNLHLNIEMLPFLVYYSYERKYHNEASMNIPGYQCSNVYINVEKGASMNIDIQ